MVGDPATSRTVLVSRTVGTSSTPIATLTTDATGAATFADAPGPGTWTYVADVLTSPAGAPVTVKSSITLPRTATTLTATGPTTAATAGSPLTVSGRLTAAGTSVAGATVRVERTGCGPTSSATVSTTPNGAWSTTDPAPPAGSCTWTATYGGSATLAPATASVTVPVALRATSLSLDLVRGTGSTKKLTYVTARLTGGPAQAVVVVTAQPSGGAPVEIASGAVDATGTFRATYQPRTTTTYRVTYAGDAWHAPAAASRAQ